MMSIGLKTLSDSGLLFELNRRVLHPVGLALALAWDDDACDGEPTGAQLLATDDAEGIVFDEQSLRAGAAKLSRYMTEVGEQKLKAREATIGFVFQGLPDSEPDASCSGSASVEEAAEQLSKLAVAADDAAERPAIDSMPENIRRLAWEFAPNLRAYFGKAVVELTAEQITLGLGLAGA